MNDDEFGAFLAECLDRAGVGAPRSWSRRLHRRRSSFRLDSVQVELEDGSGLSLVCKTTSRGALAPGTRDRKPVWRHHAGREHWCYEHVLAHLDLGTPRWFGSHPTHRWLLLEDVVAAAPLAETADPAAWEGALRSLARLHETTADATAAPDPPDAFGPDAAERWWVSAVATASWTEVEALVGIRPDFERAVAVLAAAPPVMVHGESFASNVLIEGGSDRVVLIDWEHAGIGPAGVDLAAVTAGWDRTRAEELVAVYELARGIRGDDRRRLRQEWAAARLVGAVQRLADERGRGPLERAHDWWAELLAAADHLHEEDRCREP